MSTIFDERLKQTAAALATKAEENSAKTFSEKCAAIPELVENTTALELARQAEIESSIHFQSQVLTLQMALLKEYERILELEKVNFHSTRLFTDKKPKSVTTETNNNVVSLAPRLK